MGENIGAAARAMMNFGLTDLRLVSPRDGWPNEKAVAISTGALDVMKPVQVYETLQAALHDLHFALATTARPRDMVKPVFTPQAGAQECLIRSSQGQMVGVVFGAERRGLLNDEIAACQGIIAIPTNPDFSSLNIATAVMLMSYELMLASVNQTDCVTFLSQETTPAPQKMVDDFLSRLENELSENNYFRSSGLEPTLKRNIRNIFTRAYITEQEIRTLHGIISALKNPKDPV